MFPKWGVTALVIAWLAKKGKYAAQSGSASCTLCGKDTYTDKTGQAKCTECDAGKTTETANNEKGTGAIICVEKPDDDRCDEGMARGDDGKCVACTAGKYSPNGEKCLECPQGTYSDNSMAIECTDCPAGRYGEGKGQSSLNVACKLCEEGKYTPVKASTQCQVCPPGSLCPNEGTMHYGMSYRALQRCVRGDKLQRVRGREIRQSRRFGCLHRLRRG